MVKILESATLILEAKFENFQGLFLKILSGVISNHLTLILEILHPVPSFSPPFSKSYILRPHFPLRIWEFSRATLKKKEFRESLKNL